MIHGFRTFRFRRQLSTAIIVNASNQTGRNHRFNRELSHNGRVRASMVGSETTHFLGSYLTPSLLSTALKNSAKMVPFLKGPQLHGYLYKSGLCNVLSLQNQLLHVYVRCKEFHDACNLFDEMLVRNIVTWNTLLCGFATCGAGFRSIQAPGFRYFKRMLSNMVGPDCITFTSMLRVSVELDDVEIGQQLHCFIVKLGLCVNCFVGSALVDFYSKFGLVGDARGTFDSCSGKDLVLWNVIVSCYIRNCLAEDALLVFSLMRLEGVNGDGFTYSNLLNASAVSGWSGFGRQLHSLVISLSFNSDMVVASTLVDMYAKNGNIEDARKAFDGMVFRNIFSWNTMIVGYGQHGDGKEALELLVEMFREDLRPDDLTLASVLSSCCNLSSFSEIVQLHAYAIKVGLQAVLSIANSLINAYSKGGTTALAFKCFSSIAEPDIVSWTSMIRACAFNGLPRKGIELFNEMLLNGKKPDQVVFLGVLSACSHGGLVDEGLHYFNLMTNVYNIEPNSEHYTCLIDLFGRAGLLDHALEILSSMPFEPGSDQLGAFIGACKVHGNTELAEWAAERLFVLEPEKHANYTLLCNTHASNGCWADVARVRKMMRNRCNDKVPGCSWLEIAGEIHSFVSRDKSHLALDAYALLEVLVKVMEEEYCLPKGDQSGGIEEDPWLVQTSNAVTFP